MPSTLAVRAWDFLLLDLAERTVTNPDIQLPCHLLNTVLRTVCGWTFPLFQYTEQELTYSCTFPRSISDSCRW